MRDPRILITVPTMGTVRKELSAALNLMAKDERVTVEYRTDRPYEHNLNSIAADALACGYDWWMTFDEDQAPMGCNPLDLIELDRDVVSMPAPFWTGGENGSLPFVWNAFDEAGAGGVKCHSPAEGLQKVDIVGSGAMLIHRRVLKKVGANPFACERPNGPDFAFCRRVRAAGFEIFAHYDYPCHHFVTVDMAEVATWIGSRLQVAHA